MGVIVVVCAAFGLTVWEANTEIMCLRAKGMPESNAIFSVEAVGQVYNQTNEFVYLRGSSTTMSTCPSRSTGAYATHGAASGSTLSNCTTDRALPSSSKSGCYELCTRENVVRLRHVEPARVSLRHAAPSPPQVLDSLHLLAKAQSRRPPDFLSGHAHQDEK